VFLREVHDLSPLVAALFGVKHEAERVLLEWLLQLLLGALQNGLLHQLLLFSRLGRAVLELEQIGVLDVAKLLGARLLEGEQFPDLLELQGEDPHFVGLGLVLALLQLPELARVWQALALARVEDCFVQQFLLSQDLAEEIAVLVLALDFDLHCALVGLAFGEDE